ncbi:DnaJ domain-containing protein [Acuticoccus sp. MNP-M23]|uniref:DnaJ domain-containing protein n=1 Tax=Acuticoccus sp. MNP-M23 TaxID=3072793 RepID=UPI0028159DD2|nr:DnaJ domain-containing protein [Acuticoccus sp. MNP-M23]WMS45150.1 DnaJ domain-containing protein [Acuticoccus sp. MNP-M23]
MPLLLFLPLILGVAAIVGCTFAVRWFVNANPARLAQHAQKGGSVVLLVVGALLLMRGQTMLGGSLIAAGLGKLGRSGGFGGFSGGMGGFGGAHGARRGTPKGGQASTVRTARLDATLDHDTGEIDAEILAGRHQGRQFSTMSAADVLDVWADCADDSESRLIVEAYLDRRMPEWREHVQRNGDGGAGASGGSGSSGAMTEKDAYEVLGLQPGASEAEIRASHRRMMKKMHPDQGGSTVLAARLNEAKDILLRRR